MERVVFSSVTRASVGALVTYGCVQVSLRGAKEGALKVSQNLAVSRRHL